MNKIYKLCILTALILTSALLSYKIAFSIGEKYFFDKLFYKKSFVHGYEGGPFTADFDSITNRHILKRLENLMLIQNDAKKEKLPGSASDDIYEVIVIGDSYVYGVGVQNKERFSIVLEKLLNKVRPSKVYVLGYPGDNILDNLAKYKLAKNAINIDLTVVTMVNNDFMMDWLERYPNQKNIYNELKTDCPGELFTYNWENVKNKDWNEIFLQGYFLSVTDSYANTCIMEKALSQINIKNTIFFPITPLPSGIVELSENYQNLSDEISIKDKWIMQKYKKIIDSVGGFLVNYDYSEIPENQLRVSESEGHYSALTNEKIARKLYEEIISNPRWNFNSVQ